MQASLANENRTCEFYGEHRIFVMICNVRLWSAWFGKMNFHCENSQWIFICLNTYIFFSLWSMLGIIVLGWEKMWTCAYRTRNVSSLSHSSLIMKWWTINGMEAIVAVDRFLVIWPRIVEQGNKYQNIVLVFHGRGNWGGNNQLLVSWLMWLKKPSPHKSLKTLLNY